jgi:hypothetical protein
LILQGSIQSALRVSRKIDRSLGKELKRANVVTAADLVDRISAFRFTAEASARDVEFFFDDAILLLESGDDSQRWRALERLATGFWSANHYRRWPSIQSLDLRAKLLKTLNIIVALRPLDEWITRFFHFCNDSEEQLVVIRQWLSQLPVRFPDSKAHRDAELIARLELGMFPYQTWNDAIAFIQPCIDSYNDHVRASAAGALARLQLEDVSGMPSFTKLMNQVAEWELERPGVAGPFWSEAELVCRGDCTRDQVIEWILTILEQRKGDEPCISAYDSLDFHAHKELAGSPQSIRRLMRCGREDIAAMAAADASRYIEGMREILEEIAGSSNYLNSRICSWSLAYIYRVAHPEALRRGFVRRDVREEGEVLLVFSPAHPDAYAATVYPPGSQSDGGVATYFDEDQSWQWIRRLTGSECGERKPGYADDAQSNYETGGTLVTLYGDRHEHLWSRVWVNWPKSKW